MPTLRLEANGGYFRRASTRSRRCWACRSTPAASRGGRSSTWASRSVRGRLRALQERPQPLLNFFKPEAYPGGLSYSVSLEGAFLQQTLADPDMFGADQVSQTGNATALQARVKYNFAALDHAGLLRTLSYIQFNRRASRRLRLPAEHHPGPEAFIAVGGDYYFDALHLTPGIIAGVQKPASFSTAGRAGRQQPARRGLSGKRTVVVTDVNTSAMLPSGARTDPVLSVKGTGRLQISDYVAAVGEVYSPYDNNRTTFKDDVLGVSEASFQKPYILGFNLLLQARF